MKWANDKSGTIYVPLLSVLFFVAITTTRTWYARRAFTVGPALAVRTFAIWIYATSVLYHFFAPPFQTATAIGSLPGICVMVQFLNPIFGRNSA